MLLFDVLMSSTFHQVVLLLIALVQLASWLSTHWKVQNKASSVDDWYKGYIDKRMGWK